MDISKTRPFDILITQGGKEHLIEYDVYNEFGCGGPNYPEGHEGIRTHRLVKKDNDYVYENIPKNELPSEEQIAEWKVKLEEYLQFNLDKLANGYRVYTTEWIHDTNNDVAKVIYHFAQFCIKTDKETIDKQTILDIVNAGTINHAAIHNLIAENRKAEEQFRKDNPKTEVTIDMFRTMVQFGGQANRVDITLVEEGNYRLDVYADVDTNISMYERSIIETALKQYVETL